MLERPTLVLNAYMKQPEDIDDTETDYCDPLFFSFPFASVVFSSCFPITGAVKGGAQRGGTAGGAGAGERRAARVGGPGGRLHSGWLPCIGETLFFIFLLYISATIEYCSLLDAIHHVITRCDIACKSGWPWWLAPLWLAALYR
jgi:hypothetical protein